MLPNGGDLSGAAGEGRAGGLRAPTSRLLWRAHDRRWLRRLRCGPGAGRGCAGLDHVSVCYQVATDITPNVYVCEATDGAEILLLDEAVTTS